MIDEYVFRSKYARFNSKEKRRESWSEAVDRMMDMHISQYPYMRSEIKECRNAMKEKRITGSQRALQFGGEAVTAKNMRIYNCVSSYADRSKFFSEALWLLLCGCGVGFSVQKHHVAQLPRVMDAGYPYNHVIEDSIEGWADAVDALFSAYLKGDKLPWFDYSKIRPKGSPIRFGGKAPGAEPLNKALTRIEEILESRICDKLRTIDVFDCVMHLADSVLTAGIRRAATIATFDVDDEDMLNAKVGNWFEDNPQRGRANISAVATANTPREHFDRIFKSTKEFGEPGIIFLGSKEHTVNPCVEVIMCPMLIKKDNAVVENYTLDLISFENRERMLADGYSFESGWQSCNLSTINASKVKSTQDLKDAARLASVLGTFQSAYTDTGYLGEVSHQILKRESLLGVSICGVMDSPDICLNAESLQEASKEAMLANERTANALGIRSASRITCVKPEGTTSLVLNSSSGIHPHHADRYIRRVNANLGEPVFQKFYSENPHAVEDSVWGADKVVSFAVQAPENAIKKSDLSAIEFMEKSKTVYENWVVPSTRRGRLESATHNVSITVTVKPYEWQAVQDYLWENKDSFCGVSFLSATGDYDYAQAPFQAVYPITAQSTDAEIDAWNTWHNLKRKTSSVDYDSLLESSDTTSPTEEGACIGGQCQVI